MGNYSPITTFDKFSAQVTLQYHEEDVDAFIEVADLLEEAFPSIAVEGEDAGPTKGTIVVLDGDGKQLHSFKVSQGCDEDTMRNVLSEGGYRDI